MRALILTAFALLCCGTMAAWAFAVAEDNRVRQADASVEQATDQTVANLPSE